MKIAVTTGQKNTAMLIERAKKLAAELGCEYYPRDNTSLSELLRQSGAEALIVVKKTAVTAHTSGGELFFHLNMAQLRLKNLQKGQSDNMLAAMELKPGMSVLDCTLGLGTDAVMASYAVGENGRVTGLETSVVTELIVREGLQSFDAGDELINAALRRIETVHTDYLDYLRSQPDNSYDVVYLDPMFRRPLQESLHLKPLRPVADKSPVTLAAMAEAKRVARCRVVVKEGNQSSEFKRLAITKLAGGKYSKINYGIIECGE